MPLYDYQCEKCGAVQEVSWPVDEYGDVRRGFCPRCKTSTFHHLILTASAVPGVNSYFVNGGAGRDFSNVGPLPVNFHSETSYREYLKERNWRDKDL